MHPDIEATLDKFINVYKYTGIHASKPAENAALEKLKDDLFDGISAIALSRAAELTDDFETACILAISIGNYMSKECAEKFNSAKIPFYQPFEVTPSGPPIELDSRLFMIGMTQLPPETLRPFLPALEDFFILDRYEHADYIGPDLDELIRHVKAANPGISDATIGDMTPMEDIGPRDIIGEYFKTFRTLKTYITNGEYEDDNAKILYDRMNALQSRLYNAE